MEASGGACDKDNAILLLYNEKHQESKTLISKMNNNIFSSNLFTCYFCNESLSQHVTIPSSREEFLSIKHIYNSSLFSSSKSSKSP